MIINNTPKKIAPEMVQPEALSDLILAPDGRIYLSPSFEDAADWGRVYYDGNVCIHQNGNLYCLGSLPGKCKWLPVAVGHTNVCELEEGCCLLFSECPVLSDTASVFAVFRYKDSLGLYMADSMVSEGIIFSMMQYTSEEEVLFSRLFHRMLCRHDLEAAEKVASWLKCHGANGGEV